MKLITKLFLGLIGLIIVLGVAGIILLSVFFDPNDYRDEIQQQVYKASGLQLNINDDIGWSMFPWLGLKLGNVDVAYPDKPKLASVDKVQVAVRLLPLLSGHIETSSVLVDGLTLDLKQDADGNNWTAPQGAEKAAADSKQASAETADQPAKEKSSGSSLSINIESVAVTNASVSFMDGVSNTHVTLSDLNLTTGAITLGKAVPVQFDGNFALLEQDQPSVSGSLRLASSIVANLDSQQYQLKGLKGQLEVKAKQLGKKTVSLDTRGDISVDLAAQKASLKALQLTLGGMVVKGDLDVADFANPAITGQLDIAAFDAKKLMGELGLTPLTTTKESALRKVELHTTLKGPAGTLQLDPLKIGVDDTAINGSAEYRLADGHFDVNLKGNKINIDSYLPPASNSKKSADKESASKTTTTEQGSSDTTADLSALKDINGQLAIAFDAVRVSGADLANPTLKLTANKGLINVTRLSTGLFDGSLSATASLDARNKTPKSHVKGNINKVKIGKMLTALADSDIATGTFTSTFDITTSGLDADSITRHLNGTSHFTLSDGTIKGINIAASACQGLTDFSSLANNSDDSDNATPFTQLDGRVNITNGVIANNDLTASLDQMKLAGKGKINLPAQSLDYHLGLTLEDDLFDGRCSVNKRLKGVEIPLRCNGKMSTPPAKLCGFDKSAIGDVLKAKAKDKVKEKVKEKVGDKLREKLGEKGASSLLKGLLNH